MPENGVQPSAHSTVAAIVAVSVLGDAVAAVAVLLVAGELDTETVKAAAVLLEEAALVAAVGLGPAVLPELVAPVPEDVVPGEALAAKEL